MDAYKYAKQKLQNLIDDLEQDTKLISCVGGVGDQAVETRNSGIQEGYCKAAGKIQAAIVEIEIEEKRAITDNELMAGR